MHLRGQELLEPKNVRAARDPWLALHVGAGRAIAKRAGAAVGVSISETTIASRVARAAATNAPVSGVAQFTPIGRTNPTPSAPASSRRSKRVAWCTV